MISVRLEAELENQLNYFSSQQDVSKSKIIKDSLTYYFTLLKEESTKKTAFELGSDLFGKYASGKKDLSVTYKQRLKEKINAKNNH
ncbi:hypothetical protein JHD48_05655 [Sulfurimonas sp. SAG-AH-194-I05]|nr:hypothetical protein [Sulfurimonas sp. SAG-AH-194-I05]MDF1875210.1 hypothetical protein [Sulfurimonas sp. SAG-AH-194-I05]